MSALNELLRCRVCFKEPRDRIISPEILHMTLSNLFDTRNPDFSYAKRLHFLGYRTTGQHSDQVTDTEFKDLEGRFEQ